MTEIKYPNTSMYEEVYKAAQEHPKEIAYEFQGKKTLYKDLYA